MKNCTIVLLCLCAIAQPARATTGNCNGVPDGTPCKTDQCLSQGSCVNGMCAGETPLPDGTPCVTGNACTMLDSCQKGTCTPGKQITCTPPGKCYAPSCDPASGCVFTYICDGGAPDLIMSDMTPLDGEVGDLPPDAQRRDRMCFDCDGQFGDGEVPDGEVADGTAGDGGETVDGGMGDLAPPGHVHGSGCSCRLGAGGDGAGAMTAFAALLVALGVTRRRRR